MKKIMIILVILVLLGGGGAGAFFFFMHPAEASTGPADPAAAKKEAEKAKEPAPEPKYVNLDPLTLPIIDETGVTSNVSIVVSLQVPNDEKANEVKKQLPKLTDAYIQDLYGILNKHAALKGGVVQVGIVKDRMNQIAKRVFGDDTVQDVLLQVVSQRAM